VIPLAMIVVFVLCFGIVVGTYWLLIVRPEKGLLDRLQPKDDGPKVMKGVLKKEARPPAWRKHARFVVEPALRLLEQAGTRESLDAFLGLSLLLGIAGAAAILRYAPQAGIALALLVAVLLGAIPTVVVRQIRARRISKFEDKFPEAIDLVARALRAGHALPIGLGMVADELPPPVGKEFRILFDEQNFGLTLPDALRNFARRNPLLDARFFVVAILIQRESGGNLAEVLDNLSQVIRERFKIKREISVKSAHGRLTGAVLASLPPGLFLLNGLASGGKSIAALMTPEGLVLVYVAIGLEVLGIVTLNKLVKIDY
jgi:tight adherence protein B